MKHSGYISVVNYETGHEGVREYVKHVVDAYKKHDSDRLFSIYLPVDGEGGTAYCYVEDGSFGHFKAEHGEDKAKELASGAEGGVKSMTTNKMTTSSSSSSLYINAPYLAVIRVEYDPANADKLRELAQRSEDHPNTENHSSVFTIGNIENTFFICFGLDSLDVLDTKGGLMSYVEDPSIHELYQEFKDFSTSMKLIKLRRLAEYSNA